MNRNLGIALTLLAVILIPLALYLALHVLPHAQNPYIAYWAPIAMLSLDASLFYVALGIWQLGAWDRVGIALVLPMLLAMASWAAMMGSVTPAQTAATQLIQGD